MRSSDSLRRLLSPSATRCLRSSPSTRPAYRCLHTSPRWQERQPRKPKKSEQEPYDPSKPYTNHLIPESQLTVRHARPMRESKQRSTKGLLRYTRAELKEMKQKYTPEQMAAVMAGEQSISTQDVIDQGALHQGPMTLNYLDDFSQHRPVVDKNPETPSIRDPKTGKMPKFRWKDDHDFANDLEDWLDEQPADGTGSAQSWLKFIETVPLVDSEADLSNARSFIAPELFPIDDARMKAQARASAALDETEGKMQQEYEALAKQTGFTVDEIRSFKVKFLVMRSVVNQTRLGKARSLYFLTIAGNGNGLLGVGEAKSQQPTEARKKAILDAIRNMVPIPRYEDRTIFGNVKGKSGATELELFSRHPGFGSRGQSLIWEMCKMVGIKDISARVTRSRTPMNIVKAAFSALRSQRDPEEVAMARGRRMVDLRKVYYAGGNA